MSFGERIPERTGSLPISWQVVLKDSPIAPGRNWVIALLSQKNSPTKHLIPVWIDATRGELKRIVPEQDRQEGPEWSPDIKEMAFSGFEEDKWRVGLIRPSDGATGYLTNGSAMTAGSWLTPDCNHILFSQVAPGNSWDLWLMRADGEQKSSLTTSAQTELFPDWRP